MRALRQISDSLGYVHLSDSARALPGEGSLDLKSLISALQDKAYSGWVTLACSGVDTSAPDYMKRVQRSIALLRELGIG